MNTILIVDHTVVNRNNMLIFRFYPHIFRKVRAQNERKNIQANQRYIYSKNMENIYYAGKRSLKFASNNSRPKTIMYASSFTKPYNKKYCKCIIFFKQILNLPMDHTNRMEQYACGKLLVFDWFFSNAYGGNRDAD